MIAHDMYERFKTSNFNPHENINALARAEIYGRGKVNWLCYTVLVLPQKRLLRGV